MIYVGIDVAKDKHDCCILGSEADKLFPVFTIPNNKAGFDELYEKMFSVTDDKTKIKVGLEATGHYSLNLLGSLIDKGLPTCVINPLHTNLYRKGLSLRKTKTDKVDARSIAMMLMTNKTLKPYSDISYHNEELKSLTRYRFDKVQERAKLKSSVARLVNIDEIEDSIKSIMDTCNSPIMTIPGISYRMGAMILAEIGDFTRFNYADQILAFAGLSPSTYQSGQLDSSYSHMEKRGSRYLRYALFNAAKFVCKWDENFGAYLSKKIGEGKHYNVAIGHATKKLVRTIYRMELTGEAYRR